MKKDSIYPLVRHAANITVDDIPDDILNYTKDLFLDTIGCILAGSSADGVKNLRNIIDFWGGNRQAKILSFDDKTSAPFAALLNSVMGHARDFDDTHDGAVNHGCVTIVPALLAVCEALSSGAVSALPNTNLPNKISGADFIAALAVGLDVSNRLGMAYIPYLHVGWLPTTLWGPLGSAAACGRLMRLDEIKMHHAFGIAYAQIHANRQALVDGALAKRIQPGFSSSAGVQSAFFAANDITGAKNIIDGDFGISTLYTAGKVDSKHLTENLGKFFETSNVSIKPYPCCRCTHPLIDSVIAMQKKYNIEWQEIKEGTIYIPPTSMGQIGNVFQIRKNPTVDAQFSAQYTAALTFINGGGPKLQDFEEINVMSRKEIIELASRFKVIEFEKSVSGLTPVKLHINLKTGKTLKIRIGDIKGSSTNPLTHEELILKFNDCLDNSIKKYSNKKRKNIIKAINNIMAIEDMSELIKIF